MTERQLKELVVLVYRYEQMRGEKDVIGKMIGLVNTLKNMQDWKLGSIVHGAADRLERFIGMKIWEDKGK